MIEGYYQPKETSKYNIAVATLLRLNNCFEIASNHYRKGNIKRWFDELKNIKQQVISKLKPEERNHLTALENKIYKTIYLEQKILKEKYTQPIIAAGFIEEYNEYLLDCMEDRGLLMINKADETIFT